MATKCGLVFENLNLVDAVVALVGQKRRLPGFGNAGTVASMLNFAKAAKAGRLGEAQQALEEARRQVAPLPPMPDPDVLVRRDFIPKEEADAAAAARGAFDNMYNTGHIVDVLDKLEALIVTAKQDGRTPADVLADSHMVFVGPPGTGKTTVAMRFGKLFKDLDILPSDNVTVVTGTSLMGQYVGETKEKVLKAMNQVPFLVANPPPSTSLPSRSHTLAHSVERYPVHKARFLAIPPVAFACHVADPVEQTPRREAESYSLMRHMASLGVATGAAASGARPSTPSSAR
jgi:hypothetical protein